MSYTVVGDSLIQKYDHPNVISYPGTTLERFLSHLTIFVDKKEDTEYIFCFGLNDLSSGIPENEVIRNYITLTNMYKNSCLILPPFQSDSFYDKCIDRIDCMFIPTFMSNYKTIDGLHPDKNVLTELKKDIVSKCPKWC